MHMILGPEWFFGDDLLIDLLSVIVLFLIGFFSLRFYKLKPAKKTYLQLGIAFFIISLSFLFKIFTNFTLYFDVLQTRNIGGILFTYRFIQPSDILFTAGSLLYRIFTLIGLYLLYTIYDPQSKPTRWLAILLIIVGMYFSQDSYYIFHILTLVLLLFITAKYFQNSREHKTPSARLLFTSFVIITLSHLVFCFIMLNPLFYVIAELIQLVGYILLLITFIRVLRDGKKKK